MNENFWTYYILSVFDNSLVETTNNLLRALLVARTRRCPILSVGRDGDVYYTLTGCGTLIYSEHKFEVSHV